MKVLVATQKPFAKVAVDGIKKILEEAGHEVALLEKYEAQADLVAAVADAEALIIRSDKVTEEVLAAAGKLKIVVRAGAGVDNVDLEAATKHGVVVMNTPGQNSNAVAELAIAMMICAAACGNNNAKKAEAEADAAVEEATEAVREAVEAVDTTVAAVADSVVAAANQVVAE